MFPVPTKTYSGSGFDFSPILTPPLTKRTGASRFWLENPFPRDDTNMILPKFACIGERISKIRPKIVDGQGMMMTMDYR